MILAINNKTLEDRRTETLEKLRNRLLDMITLDVITAQGEIKVTPNTENKIDFVEALSTLPKEMTILARTHIQIDGDRVDVIPVSNIGGLSQKEILEFHKESVEIAQATRKDRLEFIVQLIQAVDNEDIFRE